MEVSIFKQPGFKFRVLLSVVLILLFTEISYAHAYSLKFSFYGPRDGIAGNQVNAVVQGRSGYMWFGTEDGISRFDGYEFLNPDQETLLPDSRVFSLCSSLDGSLWAGTQSGISRINTADLTSRLFYFYSDHGVEKPLDSVRVIIQSREERIWAGTGEALLFFNEDRGRFEKVADIDVTAPGIFSIVEGMGSYLWISTGTRLLRYDTETYEVLSIEGKDIDPKSGADTFILSLNSKKDGKLWIGTNNGLFLYEYSPEEKFSAGQVAHVLKSEMILDIFISPDEDMWLGTMNGLIRIQNKGRRSIRYSENYLTTHNLRGNAVYAMFMDRAGIFWAGTNRGINKFDWGKQRFRYIADKKNSSESFKDNILSVSKGSQGIWIGTGRGVWYYKCGSSQSGFIKKLNGQKEFNTPVSVIFEDSRKRLWLSSINGFYCYHISTEVFEVISVLEEGERGENINALFEDSTGRIWIGSDRGISYFRETDHTLVSVKCRKRGDVNVTSFYETSNKKLYAGTTDAGLFVLEKGGGSSGIYFDHIGWEDNTSFRINTVSEDFDGKVLAGTDRGLLCIDERGKMVKVPWLQNHLAGRVINFIIPVRNRMTHSNELWFGTETGLLRINKKSGTYTDYRVDDGLLNEYFTHGVIADDGTVFAGTLKGVTIFKAEEINPNLFSPEIVLANLKIMGKARKRPEPGKDGVSFIRVPYDQNVISLKFAALNFSEPSKNRYAYRLGGVNSKWIDLGTKREITLFNLNPGEYQLEVIASNSDKIWNRQGRLFLIEVTPPLWMTTTFRVIIGLILMVVVLFIYNARIRIVRRQNRRLQELVDARTGELKRANEELEKLAQLDSLTQLPNRRSFFERADRLFSMAEREKYPVAIIMVDVDYFKRYNDSYGHQAGDECLVEMGSVLRKSVKRSGDIVARYGGEEFIVLLYNTEKEGALKVAGRIRKRLHKKDIGFDKSEISDRVTVSQGIAVMVPDEKFNSDIAILAADTALYQAKASGRNCVFFFNEDLVAVNGDYTKNKDSVRI